VIAAVVQARMSSVRLPGKVLRRIGAQTTLEYLLERLNHSRLADLVVVATSVDGSDDPVAALCEQRGVACHRGPLADVARRYLEVVERFSLDAFVRVTGDSPLLDQRLVDRGIELFRAGEWDLVTNVFPSTFASGHSLEVVRAATFQEGYALMSEPDHFEHVTTFFYENPERFRIHNFESDRDESGTDVSLDTEEDARLISAMIALMNRPHWEYDYDGVMELYGTLRAS